jgi:prephenate dehydrogenase
MTSPTERGAGRRAAIVGTGLIGGSIGLALRRQGWHVTGSDRDEGRAGRALQAGAIDAVGFDAAAELTFVATPVGTIAHEARVLLDNGAPVVTDVGGVKERIVGAVDHPQFIGGHPMAGSEQEGVEGADPDLFIGATWVLTPTSDTDPQAYALVHAVVSSLGADVVALEPARHDALVAVVSHVPHLTAAALMSLASAEAEQHTTLLRLAAGGFRDMTRIAAGHPGIWPDICVDNAEAIVGVLDGLLGALGGLRDAVAGADRATVLDVLERARVARRNLPGRSAGRAEELVEFRIPIPDKVGVTAEVTKLCSELGLNIYDIELVHSAEGQRGVMVLTVDGAEQDVLRDALQARGYRPAVQGLG